MEKLDQPYVALQWWQRLTGNTPSGYQSGDNRASLAELRRSTVTAAALHPETIKLFSALGIKTLRAYRVLQLLLSSWPTSKRMMVGLSAERLAASVLMTHHQHRSRLGAFVQ